MTGYILTDAARKRLAEFLGECWHRKVTKEEHLPGYYKYRCSCGKVITGAPCMPLYQREQILEHANRSFTTPDDRQALCEKLMERGLWVEFESYCYSIWRYNSLGKKDVSYSAYWLLVEKPERCCGLVDEFGLENIKGYGKEGVK